MKSSKERSRKEVTKGKLNEEQENKTVEKRSLANRFVKKLPDILRITLHMLDVIEYISQYI